MDYVFLLNGEDRSLFLRRVVHLLDCSYICLWCPFYSPATEHLICIDGWHQEDGGGLSSSSQGSLSWRLFDEYRSSFVPIHNGNVPGLAYMTQRAYIPLMDSDLMNLANIQVQRQFYQEAGIKIAIFMGCIRGEIEIGMKNMSKSLSDMEMYIHQLFSNDIIQQSVQLGEFTLPTDHPSSSSSSLRSLSVNSPDSTSLIRSKASTSFMPDVASDRQGLIRPQQMLTIQSTFNSYTDVQFPTPTTDDAEMTRAMLAVIASTSNQAQQNISKCQSDTDHPVRAFKPYNAALALKSPTKPISYGQKMIKVSIGILRSIQRMRIESQMQENRPSNTQLHHMISERKRREKLNERFHDLRMLLPSGSKKDKASVLINTKNYLNSLKNEISELKEKNKALEMQLNQNNQPVEESKEAAESSDGQRIEVRIYRAAESTSQMQNINLWIIVREECDAIDLLLMVLKYLKERGDTQMVSVDVSTEGQQTSILTRLNLRLQIQSIDLDEESFKEAMRRAVEGVLLMLKPTTNATSP